MKKILLASMLAMGALGTTVVLAKPAQNVSAHKHPNLAAAQELITQAFEKVKAAQKANEFDMDGHAQKAKDLLDQAAAEIKLAAEAANAH